MSALRHSLPVVQKNIASPINKPASSVDFDLPEGIMTFEDWGRTVCDLPKVKDLELTYSERQVTVKWQSI